MRRDLLRNFQLAAVLKIGSNTGRPKCVVSNLSLDTCRFRRPVDHPVDVRLAQGKGVSRPVFPATVRNKKPFRVILQARNLYICLYIRVEIVVGWNSVPLPPFS